MQRGMLIKTGKLRKIYIGNYSEVLPTQTRAKIKALRSL